MNNISFEETAFYGMLIMIICFSIIVIIPEIPRIYHKYKKRKWK